MLFLVVPYGDFTVGDNRSVQLTRFVDHFVKLASAASVDVCIVVSEQTAPTNKFNSGWTRNIGAAWAINVMGAERVVFNDVDLLPDRTLFSEYARSQHQSTVLHLMPTPIPGYGTNRPPVGGGVTSVGAETLYGCNGFPNDFWGWGYEDTEFERRVKRAKARVVTVSVGRLENTDMLRIGNKKMKHIEEHDLRNRDARRLLKEQVVGERWRVNGIGQCRIPGPINARTMPASCRVKVVWIKSEL